MPVVKVIAGKFWASMEINPYSGGRYSLKFSYNPHLITEVKALEGARWNPEERLWTIVASDRNRISLDFLQGKDPYSRYREPIIEYDPNREILMKHQEEAFNFVINKRRCMLAHEMGLGKTLVAIEIMEISGHTDWLYVAPKSVIRAVQLELVKWRSELWPEFCTYDSLHKESRVYKGIVFDESQKLKNPNTRRYDAAKSLVHSMIDMWENPYILLMSGTPAPNSPADYWSQIELIAPGYLRESTIDKFKKRMGLIIQEESLAGGKFPKLVCWWSDENLCQKCGKPKEALEHDIKAIEMGLGYHEWERSVNEVEKLYKILQPMVNIRFKKDVLELPDKIYRIIECEPNEEMLRAARLVVINAKNSATAAIQLREISDGFLYRQKPSGEKVCELCHGKRTIIAPAITSYEYCQSCGGTDIQDGICIRCGTSTIVETAEDIQQECPRCGGEGTELTYERVADMVPCPKEDIIKELLEEYEDVGRVVIYAGFSGSIDRCMEICKSCGWEFVKIDGRGWYSSITNLSEIEMIQKFQTKSNLKIAIVAQPDAGGLGLTFTASPVEIFYSNSTIPGSRLQSEDRGHRPGMDQNRGLTIIDICHLPTDKLILEKLKMKQKVQSISLGEFTKALERKPQL